MKSEIMSFQENINSVLSFNGEGLKNLINDEDSIYHVIVLIGLRALIAGIGILLLGILYPDTDFPEHFFLVAIRVTLARALLLVLFVFIFAGLLVFSLNKLGGTLQTIHCFRIIGLTFIFDLIYDSIAMVIRLININNNLPWYVLVYIPAIFVIAAIVIGFTSDTKISRRDILIATVVCYIFSNIGSAMLYFLILSLIFSLFNPLSGESQVTILTIFSL